MDAQTFSEVKGFFDEETHTISYVITDKQTNSCAVLDSVLDLDYASGKINYLNADKIINFITENNLKLCWLIETHVHADHLSAAPYIQQNLGGKIAISKEIVKVQEIFGKWDKPLLLRTKNLTMLRVQTLHLMLPQHSLTCYFMDNLHKTRLI